MCAECGAQLAYHALPQPQITLFSPSSVITAPSSCLPAVGQVLGGLASTGSVAPAGVDVRGGGTGTAVDMRGGGGHVPSIVCANVLSTWVVAVVARMVTLLAAAHRRLWDRQVTHMSGARVTCASLHSCSARQPKLSSHFSHGSRGGQDRGRGREDHAGW